MAETYKRDVNEIREILTANGNLTNMKSELVVKKTIDFLVESSNTIAATA